MKPPDLEKIPKGRRDWLEIYGNVYRPAKVMPGTCEACVWGRGAHSVECEERQLVEELGAFVDEAINDVKNVEASRSIYQWPRIPTYTDADALWFKLKRENYAAKQGQNERSAETEHQD